MSAQRPNRDEGSLMQQSRDAEDSFVHMSETTLASPEITTTTPGGSSLVATRGNRDLSRRRRAASSRVPLLGTCLSWYRVSYDNNIELTEKQRKQTARYCGGRIKRGPWICMNLMLVSFFMGAILLPIAYYAIIPWMIRDKFANIPLNTMQVSYMNLSSFTNDSVGYAFQTQLPKQFWFPIKAGIAATDIAIVNGTDSSKELLRMGIPDVALWIHKPVDLQLSGSITFAPENWAHVSELIQEISSGGGLESGKLAMQAKLAISVFGLTLYKNFEISRDVELPHLKPSVLSVFDSLPSFMFMQNAPSLSSIEVMKQYNVQPTQLWAPLESFAPLAMTSLDVTLTETGPRVETKLFIRNPTVLNVDMDHMDVGISLENTVIGRLKLQNVKLNQGINELALIIDFDTTGEEVDSKKVSQALSSTIRKILSPKETESVQFGVAGPLTLQSSYCWTEMTRSLRLGFPLDDVLKQANAKALGNLFTRDGVRSLLSGMKISADVYDDHIASPITLPIPLSIPLPPFSFRYNMSFDMSATDEILSARKGNRALDTADAVKANREEARMMGISLNGLDISTKDSHMLVSTSVLVFPVNTTAAAESLADSLAPMLHGQDTSAIDIVGLRFSDSSHPTFEWSRRMFEDTAINFPLPGLNIVELLADFTQNFSSLPIVINKMDVTQMDSEPGFSCNGSFAVGSSPEIRLTMGYVSAGISAEKTPLIAATLPSGIRYRPEAEENELSAAAVFQRAPELPESLQRLVDSLFLDNSPSSSIGLSQIRFGASANTAWVTFSRISVDLETEHLTTIAQNLLTGAVDSQRLAIEELDVDIKKATSLDVNIATSLSNSMNIAVKTGDILADIYLDENKLVGAGIKAVELPRGNSHLRLQTKLELSTGADGMAEKMAQFVPAIVYGNQPVASSLILRGVTLKSPSGNAQASIDQLSTLQIKIPGKLIEKYNPLHPTGDSKLPIDFSKVLPKSIADVVHSFAINELSEVSVATKPKQSIEASVDFSYTLGLAVKAKLPFMRTSFLIDHKHIVHLSLSNLIVGPKGVMKPAAALEFSYESSEQEETASNIISELINDLLACRDLSKDVGITELVFGSSSEDTNDLLHLTDLSMATTGLGTENLLQAALDLVLVPHVTLPLKDFSQLTSWGLSLGNIEAKSEKGKIMDISTNIGGLGAVLKPRFSLDIGYIAALADVGNAPFVGASFPSGLSTHSSVDEKNHTLSVGMMAKFVDTEETANNIAVGVNNFIAGKPLDTNVRAKDVQIGHSSEDFISVFRRMAFEVSLDDILSSDRQPVDVTQIAVGLVKKALHIPTASSEPSALALISEISKVSFETLPQAQLNVGATVVVDMGLPIVVDLGHVGAGMSLDSVKALEIALDPFHFQPKKSLDISTTLQFHDDETLADKLGELSNRYEENGLVKAAAGIGGITFGASKELEEQIMAFSRIQISVDLDKLLGPVTDTLFGTFKLPLESMSDIKDGFGLEVGKAAISTAPGKAIALETTASFRNPLAVSVKIGYFGTDIGVKTASLSAPFLGVNIPSGLSVKPAGELSELSMNLGLAFKEDTITPVAISQVFDNFVKGGPLAASLPISNIALGYSATDSIKALRKVRIPLNLDRFIRLSKPIDLTGSIVDAVSSMFTGNETNSMSAVTLKSAEVEMLPQSSIGFGATVGIDIGRLIGISFPVTVDMGYVGTDCSVDQTDAFSVRLEDGIHVDSSGSVGVKGRVVVFDGEPLADKLAQVTTSYDSEGSFRASAGIGKLTFGSSSDMSEQMMSFSAIRLSLDLDKLVLPIIDSVLSTLKFPLTSFADLKEGLGLEVGSAKVATEAGKAMTVEGAASFHNPLKISVKLNYLSTDVGLRPSAASIDSSLVAVRLPSGIALEPKGKLSDLQLAMNLQFQEDLSTPQAVASLFDNFIKGGSLATTMPVSNLRIGYSAEDNIKAFRKMKIPINLDKIVKLSKPIDLPGAVVDIISHAFATGESQADYPLNLKSLAVEMLPQASIGLGAAVTVDIGRLIGITFPVVLDIGSLTTDLLIDETKAFAVHLEDGIHLGKTGAIDLKGRVGVYEGEQLENKMETVSTSFEADGSFHASAIVEALVFGSDASKENTITAFSGIKVPMDLDKLILPVINEAMGAMKFPLTSLEDIKKGLGLEIGSVSLKTAPEKSLAMEAKAGFNSPFSISLKLGYFSTHLGLRTHGVGKDSFFLELGVPQGISLEPKEKLSELSMNISLAFKDDPSTPQAVANVFNSIVKAGPLATELPVSGVLIGYSEDDHIKSLRKMRIPVNLDKIVRFTKPLDFTGGVQDIISHLLVSDPEAKYPVHLQSVEAEMLPKAVIGFEAAMTVDIGRLMGISFPISLDMGFIGTGLLLGEVDAFGIRVNNGIHLDTAGALAVKGEIAVNDGEPLTRELREIADGFSASQKFPGAVSVGKLLFGQSQVDVIQTFSEIRLDLELDALLRPIIDSLLTTVGIQTSDGVTGGELASALGVAIDFANIKTMPEKKLALESKVSFKNPFTQFKVKVGYFATDIGFDVAPLLSVQSKLPLLLASDATQSPPKTALDINMDITFTDNAATPPVVGQVVKRVLAAKVSAKSSTEAGKKSRRVEAAQEVPISAKVAVSKLQMGYSSEDYIHAFSAISLLFDLNQLLVFGASDGATETLLESINRKVGEVVLSLVGDEKAPGSGAKVVSATVAALPKKTLGVGAKGELDFAGLLGLSFPLKAEIGYAGVSLSFDDINAFDAQLDKGLVVSSGEKAFELMSKIRVDDSLPLQEKLAAIVDKYNTEGTFPGFLSLHNVAFGSSSGEGSFTNAFSQVQIPLQLESLLSPIAKQVGSYVSNMLDSLATQKDILGTLLDKLQKGEKISLTDGLAVLLSGADCAFEPQASVSVHTPLTVFTPWALTASIKALGLGLQLDSVPFLGLDMGGIDISGAESKMDLKILAKIAEGAELIDKIGALSQGYIDGTDTSGSIRFGGVKLGASDSEEDVIKAFSRVYFAVGLKRVLDPIVKGLDTGNVDLMSLLNKFDFQINSAEVGSAPGQAVIAAVGAGFNNPYPITATGLGFFNVHSIGLDAVKLLGVEVGDEISLAKGKNALNVSPKVSFVSGSPEAKKSVAVFAKALISAEQVKNSVTVKGISLGKSKDNAIRAFEKLALSIPATAVFNAETFKLILTQLIGIESVDGLASTLMDQLMIESALIDAENVEKQLKFDAGLHFTDITPNIKVNFQFLSLSASISGQELGAVSIPGGIHIGRAEGETKGVRLSLESTIALRDSEPLESVMAILVGDLQNTDLNSKIAGTFGGMKLSFGVSETDRVDLFEEADLAFALDPMVQPLRRLVHEIASGIAYGDTKYTMTPKDMKFYITEGAVKPNLQFDGSIKLAGIPEGVVVKLPYMNAEVSYNGQLLLVPLFQNMRFIGGNVDFTTSIPFTSDGKVVNDFFNLFVDMAFHRNQNGMKADFSLKNFRFGHSESNSYGLMRKGEVNLRMDRVLQEAWTYFDSKRPMEFDEINANIVPAGADTFLVAFPLKGPVLSTLTIDIPSMLGKGFYQKDTVIGDGYFTDIRAVKGSQISFKVLVVPREPGIVAGLNAAVPRLLEWESFTQDISLGGLTMYSVRDAQSAPPDKACTVFSSLQFETPPLFMFDPLYIKPSVKLFPLQLSIDISFRNGGPLYADVSDKLYANINHREKTIIKASIENRLVVHNAKSNNGQTTITVVVKPQFSVWELPKMLLDLLHPAKNYNLEFDVLKGGQHVEWLNQCLNQLPRIVISKLVPIIVGLFKHVKLRIPFLDKLLPSFDSGHVRLVEGNGEGVMPDMKTIDDTSQDAESLALTSSSPTDDLTTSPATSTANAAPSTLASAPETTSAASAAASTAATTAALTPSSASSGTFQSSRKPSTTSAPSSAEASAANAARRLRH